MYQVSIALSLLCILFYVAREQIRLYHHDQGPTWHSSVEHKNQSGCPLFVTPALTFGKLGQPLSIKALS